MRSWTKEALHRRCLADRPWPPRPYQLAQRGPFVAPEKRRHGHGITIGPATAAAAQRPRSTRSLKTVEELKEPPEEPEQRGHDGVERCHRRGGPKKKKKRPLDRCSQQGVHWFRGRFSRDECTCRYCMMTHNNALQAVTPQTRLATLLWFS